MSLTAIQAIKNKVENSDLILETNKKIVKDYLQGRLDELAEISVNEIKSFIENIATICNNEVNELFYIGQCKVFSNENFDIFYYHDHSNLEIFIKNPFPSEIQQAIIKDALLNIDQYRKRIKDLKFIITDEDGTVIIDTIFKINFFNGFNNNNYYFSLGEIVPE